MTRTPLRIFVVAALAAGCTRGADLLESYGTSYTTVGETGGSEKGPLDDDEGGDITGPLDEGAEDPSGAEAPPPPPGTGDCCIGHDSAGCDDAVIETCVCAQDPFCCESEWDDLCVSLVLENMCGLCDAEPGGEESGGEATGDPSTTGAGDEGTETGGQPDDAGDSAEGEAGGDEGDGGVGNCCDAHVGGGCTGAAIEACVCAEDNYCCDTEWDDICVGEVESLSCGDCGGGVGTEDGGEEESSSDDGGVGDEGGVAGPCCLEHATPGCDDAAIEACVCAEDGFCCETEWDDVCVGEVDSFGCGSCGGGTDGGTEEGGTDEGGTDEGGIDEDCCLPPGGVAGCSDPEVESCVCASDAWCCDVEWDAQCVDEIAEFGCGSC